MGLVMPITPPTLLEIATQTNEPVQVASIEVQTTKKTHVDQECQTSDQKPSSLAKMKKYSTFAQKQKSGLAISIPDAGYDEQ